MWNIVRAPCGLRAELATAQSADEITSTLARITGFDARTVRKAVAEFEKRVRTSPTGGRKVVLNPALPVHTPIGHPHPKPDYHDRTIEEAIMEFVTFGISIGIRITATLVTRFLNEIFPRQNSQVWPVRLFTTAGATAPDADVPGPGDARYDIGLVREVVKEYFDQHFRPSTEGVRGTDDDDDDDDDIHDPPADERGTCVPGTIAS